VTELIVSAGELCVGDPNSNAFALCEKLAVNVRTEVFPELVRRGSESPHPDLAPHPLVDTLHSIAQPAIAARAVLKIPLLQGDASLFERGDGRCDAGMAPSRHGPRLAALETRGGERLMSRLEFVTARRGAERAVLADLELLGLGTLARGRLSEASELGEGVRTLLGARARSNRLSAGLCSVVVVNKNAEIVSDLARTLSCRSSTMLLSGPVALLERLWELCAVTMDLEARALLRGLRLALFLSPWRRWTLAGTETRTLASSGGLRGEGASSATTTVLGRKREAMMILWFLKELIAGGNGEEVDSKMGL